MQFPLKDKNVKKCIRMGINVLKLSFGEIKNQFYGCELHFKDLQM